MSRLLKTYSNLRWKVAQWFELRWWKHYLHKKDKSQYLNWKRNYWQQVLNTIADVLVIQPTMNLCDLGCGPAGIFIALPENNITAVDPLIHVYASETSVFTASDYRNTNFVCTTIENFSSDATFDVVFCLNAINHVKDIDKGFDKLSSLCASNGTVVLSIDAHNFSFFKILFRFVPGDILHPHQYDRVEYNQLLEKQNFRILKTVLLKKEWLFSHYLMVATRL